MECRKSNRIILYTRPNIDQVVLYPGHGIRAVFRGLEAGPGGQPEGGEVCRDLHAERAPLPPGPRVHEERGVRHPAHGPDGHAVTL